MKREIHIFRAALIFVLILFGQLLSAKDPVLNKSFKWSYPINPDATIELKNYDCDLTISSSSNNQVVLELLVDAESNDQEDLDDLAQHLENLKFDASSNKVELETTFWESRNSRGRNNMRMKLRNGPTINLTEFKIRGRLSIPKSVKLDLNSKYSDIALSDVEQLNLDSYDDEIRGAKVVGDVNIKAKYSNMDFTEFGDTEMDIYDSKINAEETGNLEIKSKYSDIIIDAVEYLDIESYDDNFKFRSTGNVKMTAKYSDFKCSSSGNLTLSIYDSDFEIDEIVNLKINASKYSGYIFKKAEVIEISETYDDVFKVANIGSMGVNYSKYSDFIFEKLDESFEIIDGYDDIIKINNTSPSFSHFDINCKYGKVNLKTHDGLPLKIDWKTKYGKIEFDDSKVTTRVKIKESSEYEFQGFRGKEGDDVPIVKVRGYSVNMNLVE